MKSFEAVLERERAVTFAAWPALAYPRPDEGLRRGLPLRGGAISRRGRGPPRARLQLLHLQKEGVPPPPRFKRTLRDLLRRLGENLHRAQQDEDNI